MGVRRWREMQLTASRGRIVRWLRNAGRRGSLRLLFDPRKTHIVDACLDCLQALFICSSIMLNGQQTATSTFEFQVNNAVGLLEI